MPENIKNSNLRLFADDCILYKSIETRNDLSSLQEDLLNLEQWKAIWLMKFNPLKWFPMTISLATKHKILHDYTLYGCFLSQVNQLKYLGVILYKAISNRPHTFLKLPLRRIEHLDC